MHVAVAPVCAGCRIAIPPQHLFGFRRGRCPNCGPDVEVIAVAIAGPMSLVATFPTPRSPPAGMALERAEVPALPPAAPVGDGPFRTPGRLRVERRDGGSVRIRLPKRHGAAAIWAVIVTTCIGLLAISGGAAIVAPLLLWLVVAGVATLVLRKRSWIELSPSSVWVQHGAHIAHRLDRARITHIRCVCPNPTGYGPPHVPWEVWVTVDGVPTPLVTARSLDHATAIAELLVHELGLPTWIPVPLLPG